MNRRRPRRGTRLKITLTVVLLVGIYVVLQPRERLSGPAKIHDGDTLSIGQQRIRLFGIDAPEYGQTCKDADGADWPCGRDAARHLRDLTAGQTVACKVMDHDRYERVVARCFVGHADLGATLVGQGYAIAFRRYASDYVRHERQARRARRGLWAGSFEQPEAYRDEFSGRR